MFTAVQILEHSTPSQSAKNYLQRLIARLPRLPFGLVPLATCLSCCFVLTSAIHYVLLEPVTAAPYVAHDELQYALTGENIRAGNGFVLRGEFNSTLPPLTPWFVAWSHGLTDNPRRGFFLMSVLAICSMLFPVYLISRRIGLTRWPSVGIALAATFMPQTFYAGMYLSETLHLPMFFWAFWLMLRWLDRPRAATAVALGFVLAAMGLNRIATLTPLLSFYAVVLGWFITGRFRGEARPFGYISAFAPLLMFLSAQASWWWYKSLHGASLLGVYAGSRPVSPSATFELFTVYLVDLFLAPAIVAGGCYLMGIHEIRKSDSRQAWLLFLMPFVLVITTFLSDGRLTGYLRERYFIYASPLLMAVAARGVRPLLAMQPSWAGRVILVCVPLMCLFGYMLYTFPVPPLVETSWAHAVGTTGSSFSRQTLLWNSLLVLGVMGWTIVRFPRQAQSALCLYFVAFQLFAFVRVSAAIGEVTASIAERMAVFTTLLPVNTKPLQRVFIGGIPPSFDQHLMQVNDAFIASHRNQGLIDEYVWYLETLRLLDVRMCGSADCVLQPDARGAYLLTTLQFSGLEIANKRRGYYLYRVPDQGIKTIVPVPTTIPASRFSSTPLTERMLRGEIAGRGDGRTGLLMQGPYLALRPGAYSVRIDMSATPTVPYRIDIVAGTRVLSSVYGEASRLGSIDFSLSRATQLDVRLIGPNRSDLVVRGANLTRRSAQWTFARAEYVRDFEAEKFGTAFGGRASGAIVGSNVEQIGYFVYGPYEVLPAGVYDVEFLLSGGSPDPVALDVYAGPDVLAVSTVRLNEPKRLRFTADGHKRVEFRVHCRNHPSLRFTGAKLTLVEDPPEPAAVVAGS